MDQRGLPFGYPVAPNRIIANCLLAGKKLYIEERREEKIWEETSGEKRRISDSNRIIANCLLAGK